MPARVLVLSVGLVLVTTPIADAQQPPSKVRIGVLSQGFPQSAPGLPLIQAMAVLGWVEG